MKKKSIIVITIFCFFLMISITGCRVHPYNPELQKNTIWCSNDGSIRLEFGESEDTGIIVNGDEEWCFQVMVDEENQLHFRDLALDSPFVRDHVEIFDCSFKNKKWFTAKVIKGTHLQVGDEYVFYRVEE